MTRRGRREEQGDECRGQGGNKDERKKAEIIPNKKRRCRKTWGH